MTEAKRYQVQLVDYGMDADLVADDGTRVQRFAEEGYVVLASDYDALQQRVAVLEKAVVACAMKQYRLASKAGGPRMSFLDFDSWQTVMALVDVNDPKWRSGADGGDAK